MRHSIMAVPATALALALAGAAISTPATAGSGAATDATPERRAAGAAQDFGARLRSALSETMKAGGPLAAIDFCHAQAPLIASEVMVAHGVRLGRVAVAGRTRNPLNAAQEWQADALARFEAAAADGASAADLIEVQRESLPEGLALRWMRGIEVEAPCLACHGTEMAPAVREALRRHYPEDKATGFALGDLRGALWVEVPSAHAPAVDATEAGP